MGLSKDIRWYPYGDQKFMSVTSILKVINKPELVNWAAKEAAKAKDAGAATKIATAAASRGTRFHKWVEQRFKGINLTDLVSEEQGFRNGWLALEKKYQLQLMTAEEVVVNVNERYAGTLDATYTLDGVPTLFDYKTVSDGAKLKLYPPYREHRLQLEAYRRAKYSMTGIWIPQVALARLAPDGQYCLSLWRCDDVGERLEASDAGVEAEGAWCAFLNARDLLEWLVATENDYGDSWNLGYYEEVKS